MTPTRNRKRDLDRTLLQARSDYARYVGTETLFGCQRAADVQVNADELAFQVVHQVEELWMKLAAHTLIDIEEGLRAGVSASSILRGFSRVRNLLALMARQLSVLDTMSSVAYAEIRRGLGRGSGQDSPGYSALLEHGRNLWPAFKACFPVAGAASAADVFRCPDAAAFAIAEAMIDLDIGLARFRHEHLQLVDRMIGLDSRSLKGMPAAALSAGVDRRLFAELWVAREGARTGEPIPPEPRMGNAGRDAAVRAEGRRTVSDVDWK